ncbi:hypothetical protein BDK51DRAFT_22215 [Blyttiomyces helicus]|uniref:SMP domain-containing protein n=1 Tax=Blyttiomyces helicus TaxID=388810 RepID=A0A4P9W3R5_9FUNG|nr:hypothetical protein BDK51DRAFT_22215 [Blyttiomyces helicus]|eukprot:RKO85903.1 hypothetical protein BDK51DRAFT_22215 [Blyttiomyces helicus]
MTKGGSHSGGSGGGFHPMTKSDSSHIQSTQATAGRDFGAGSFAARAQSAGDRNAAQGK